MSSPVYLSQQQRLEPEQEEQEEEFVQMDRHGRPLRIAGMPASVAAATLSSLSNGQVNMKLRGMRRDQHPNNPKGALSLVSEDEDLSDDVDGQGEGHGGGTSEHKYQQPTTSSKRRQQQQRAHNAQHEAVPSLDGGHATRYTLVVDLFGMPKQVLNQLPVSKRFRQVVLMAMDGADCSGLPKLKHLNVLDIMDQSAAVDWQVQRLSQAAWKAPQVYMEGLVRGGEQNDMFSRSNLPLVRIAALLFQNHMPHKYVLFTLRPKEYPLFLAGTRKHTHKQNPQPCCYPVELVDQTNHMLSLLR